MIGQKIFFTKGVGVHKEYLASFEAAIKNAGISPFNLVTVSSIFPPGCKRVSREEGLKFLTPGQIIYVVMSRNATNEPNRLIASSVGCALPADPSQYGDLSEHHSCGETDQKAGDYAEDLAAQMLAATLGIDFDPQKDYDERRGIYRMSGKIVDTFSATCTTRGDGIWTTVVVAAVFLL